MRFLAAIAAAVAVAAQLDVPASEYQSRRAAVAKAIGTESVFIALSAQPARRTGDRFTFVGIDVQDSDSDAQAFIRKYGLTYLNGSGNAGPISVQYGMRGVPETYFIAPDARLIRKWNTLTAADLEQFLGELQRASGARSG